MSKKDFEAIAAMFNSSIDNTVKGEYNDGYNDALVSMAWEIADHFAAQNPRFDRYRFLTACGL